MWYFATMHRQSWLTSDRDDPIMERTDPGKLPTLSEEDIWASDRLLQWLANRFTLKNRKGRLTLLAVVILPFMVTAIAAWSENRFMLGQLTEERQIAVLTPEHYQQLRRILNTNKDISASLERLKRLGYPGLEAPKDALPVPTEKRQADSGVDNDFEFNQTGAALTVLLKKPPQPPPDAVDEAQGRTSEAPIYINTKQDYLEELIHLKTISDEKRRKLSMPDYLKELIHPKTIADEKRRELSTKMRSCIEEAGWARTYEIVGMSYLGDPMVWPFYLLVPLALVLLAASIGRVAAFLADIRTSINTAGHDAETLYAGFVAKAQQGFRAHGTWRWVKYIGVLSGLLFILYNWITCTFPHDIHPYSSGEVFTVVDGQIRQISLLNRIDIPKWDIDVLHAPLSWTAARIWVVFGYGLVPIILAKLINVVGVLYSFCSAIGKKNLLIVKPLSHDKAGGFSKLSDAAIAFVYVVVPYMIMVIASFFKEATPASLHNYLLVLTFTPVFFIIFFTPLISFHMAMKTAKIQYLKEISVHYNTIQGYLLTDITQGRISDNDLETKEKHLAILKKMHSDVGAMSEWPIEVGNVYRFVGSFSVPPILGALFKYLLKIF